ncbi:beta-galactosidase [Kutzneria sp. CA-103260]|uniref:beta-galactosidase n=1 Tax=Kutzneria sp. CA-103260 TaxID=2802641 RepID=UPI001BAE4C37|nr:beta-galactosidase [Kutzneria sp. CA-103260]QUQ66145.1 beta-galactosidase [Kutzneria sp. CA-103260]
MEIGRRRFLAISGLAPLAVSMPSRRHRFGFAADGSGFLLDGRPFQIRSGEMHPARIPVEHWRHRILMAKAMGLNTISIYVMWNYVESKPGVFDWRSERRDVEAFIRLCQAEGMWVLLRPGPYVCGEWDLGGIPPYLLATKDIRLRVHDDARYMAAVGRYIGELAPRIKPLLSELGGPILMVQIENEYGSYGSDPAYLAQLRQLWLDQGVDGPFYTEDGLGQVEQNHSNVTGGAIALSGGDAQSIAAARKAFPGVPAMAGEVYPGWLTHWGENFAGPSDISADLKAFMAGGLSFNLYMAHGGTSFGFYAGANANNLSGAYQPDITSYDYAAPITEQGVATPQYHAYRDLIAGYLKTTPPPIPDPKPTIVPAPVTPAVHASLWDNLPSAVTSTDPQPFEMLGQNYGFALYRTTIAGAGSLDIRWVHDYATVFVDGHYQGGLSRPLIPDAEARKLNVTNNNAPLTLTTSGTTLDILVEGMGRTNYGQAIVDRKGILESASLQGKPLTGWRIFPLPLDNVSALKPTVTDPTRPGLFFRATVTLDRVGDTYLDLSGWTKGVVWVNGHNLGRYWEIGPQHRLYCPVSWLRPGANEILVFDLHQTTPRPISFARTLN